jgi:hypothetical protein
MSSSSAGQWIPTPGPINSHRSRSRGEPWTSRGYHRSGTETVRPSRKSTTSARAVTRADFASAVSISGLEVLIPRLQQLSLVFTNEAFDPLSSFGAKPKLYASRTGESQNFAVLSSRATCT